MRAATRLAAVAILCAGLTAPAALALAKLPVPTAAKRSDGFAKRTCARDKQCIEYGVLNCRRHGPGAVLCRIYDERRTRVQGRYRCNRLIRVALDPSGHRMPVTGLGRWHC